MKEYWEWKWQAQTRLTIKKNGEKKGQSAKFQKKEYNAPLKYKSKASDQVNKKVKLAYHVDRNDRRKFYNKPINTVTEEKTVNAEVEIFDNGTEEQFLIFKRNIMQTIAGMNLEPADEAYGAEHLYSLVRKALRYNALEEWLEICANRAKKNHANFHLDLWELTEQQINKDTIRQKKRYLEKTQKPGKLTSKEWRQEQEEWGQEKRKVRKVLQPM